MADFCVIRRYASFWFASLLSATSAYAAPPIQVTPGVMLTTTFTLSALPSANSSYYQNAEGCRPASTPLVGQDGTLYGNMSGCGRFNSGTAYSFSTAGGKKLFKVLHTFSAVKSDGTNYDGFQPYGDTVQDLDGTLYSTARYGGSGGCGTVYSISSTGTFKVLHSFAKANNGTNHGGCLTARGVIIASDGALYGTTFNGGSEGGGTIYRLNADGSSFTVLHEFKGGPRDGFFGKTGLTEIGGSVYGVTQSGCPGSAGGADAGCIFAVSESDGTYRMVFGFSNTSNGSNCFSPDGGVTLASDGLLYGMTSAGGPNDQGCIYRVQQDGSGFQVLWAFSASTSGSTPGISGDESNLDGAIPAARLTAGQDGRLYGTTSAGGSNGNGTLFAIDTTGTFSLLRSFDAANNLGQNAYGAEVDASLVETSPGVFVGVAGSGGGDLDNDGTGGFNGTGEIFTLTLPSTAPSIEEFPEIVGAVPAVLETSDPIKIEGFSKPRIVTVTGGSYSINGGEFTTASGTVSNGDFIQLQTTSSDTAGAMVSAILQFTPGNSRAFKVITH